MLSRVKRAEQARGCFDEYNPVQQEFLEFVLEQYVETGVSELDDAKLGKLLELKYKAIADAKQVLGDIESIRDVFVGFQLFLYMGDDQEAWAVA
jgi:type I restriction enzyme, R subunit